MARIRDSLWMIAATSLAATLGSCSVFPQDPVHEAAVRAMGDEIPGTVPESQYHRAGQPCLVCHNNQGPADLRFAVAGTVFWGRCDCKPGAPLNQGGCDPAKGRTCDQTPVEGAQVRIRDWKKSEYCLVTNCAGNFMLPVNEGLEFPFLVSVSKTFAGSPYARVMGGHVGREGSCAGCHKNPTYQDSPGQIRLIDNNKDIPVGARPVACPPQQGVVAPTRCQL